MITYCSLVCWLACCTACRVGSLHTTKQCKEKVLNALCGSSGSDCSAYNAQVRHLIEGFWKETHLAAGYELVNSPHVAKTDLWRISGHYDFYKENMFDRMEVHVSRAFRLAFAIDGCCVLLIACQWPSSSGLCLHHTASCMINPEHAHLASTSPNIRRWRATATSSSP